MLSGFVKAICRIGIFIICSQAIVHFRPKASYEKYLKMLISAMILMQIIAFSVGLLGLEGEKEMLVRTELSFPVGEETVDILGTASAGRADESEQFIQNIHVQIGDISPIQVEVSAGKHEPEREGVHGSEGNLEEMVP